MEVGLKMTGQVPLQGVPEGVSGSQMDQVIPQKSMSRPAISVNISSKGYTGPMMVALNRTTSSNSTSRSQP